MADLDTTSNSNEERFIALMNASQRELRAFIIGLVPHHVDADDVLQNVNLALWRKRNIYDTKQKYIAWAVGFAYTEIRKFRSQSSSDRLWFSDSVEELLVDEWNQAEGYIEDCRRSLAECVRKLGNPERQVIESRYSKQLTVRQISEISGTPLRTVYKTLGRAIESLRQCVKRSRLQAELS